MDAEKALVVGAKLGALELRKADSAGSGALEVTLEEEEEEENIDDAGRTRRGKARVSTMLNASRCLN